MNDHLNAHAIRADHENTIAEAMRVLANMPERDIHPRRLAVARLWVAEHRRDRRFAAVRSRFVSQPSFTPDV